MYCESCGSFIPDGQAYCANCGSPAPQPAAQPVPAQPVYQQPAAQPVPVTPVYQQPVAQPVQPVTQPVQPVYQQPSYQQPVYQQSPVIQTKPALRSNGFATAGLIFGILTFIFGWIPVLPYVLGFFGLLFSILGLVKKNAGGKGKAIAGLILTIIGAVSCALIFEFLWKPVGEEVGNELGDAWDEAWDEAMASYNDDLYSTSYSDNYTYNSDDYYIDGDFVTTDKGYVSGVLLIDACTFEIG